MEILAQLLWLIAMYLMLADKEHDESVPEGTVTALPSRAGAMPRAPEGNIGDCVSHEETLPKGTAILASDGKQKVYKDQSTCADR